ncbi:GTP-binding protein GEM [Aphelenchoides bicaudatus]|nr:GTP-binding protein GEM [Aphelenchoides bicaudatus]
MDLLFPVDKLFDASASPRRMLATLRPASARPYRRRRKLERNSYAFDYDDEDEDDIFSTNSTNSQSPSPKPMSRSLRASPLPMDSSTASMINECLGRQYDEPACNSRNLFVGRYCTDPLPTATANAQPILYPHPKQIRTFNTDSRGRIVDCGFRERQSRPLNTSAKNRRSTCPEIWLSVAEDTPRPITYCVMRIYGLENVGKKSLARQMAAHADIRAHQDLNLDYDERNFPLSNIVAFMMDDEEVQLEILHGNEDPKHTPTGYMTIYMLVYSVDSRDSFVRAAQLLYRLHDCRRTTPASPVVLVANKADLQRKRRISFVEGKMLSKIYKCAFVETSSLLSMSMDLVWEETLRKFQKYKLARERQLRNLKNVVRKHSPSCLMNRIVKQGRRFAKSCEELVARLAAFLSLYPFCPVLSVVYIRGAKILTSFLSDPNG